jgi:PhzF family phenazine biosynthesis protein
MALPSFVVSAFTDRPFSGNPAAVCPLDQPRPDAWLQAVAADFNLSETAYLLPTGKDRWQLRWFTPTDEVDLCGHATLAAAHTLWQELGATADLLSFETRSGVLTTQRRGNRIAMDFPATPQQAVTVQPDWQDAVQGRAINAVRGNQYLLLELQSEQQVREFIPDFLTIGNLSIHGLMITARSTSSDADFVSRFFAPKLGVDEDPVTGSAHCLLGPYWGKRLNKTTLLGHQVSKRGGYVGVELLGERLNLIGTAITTLRGTLHVD